MDEDSIELALKLQIEDLQEIISKHDPKGKAAAIKAPPDNIQAAQEQILSLENAIAELQGFRLVRSMARALRDDQEVLNLLLDEEQRASRDRNMALQMGGRSREQSIELPIGRIDSDSLRQFESLSLGDETEASVQDETMSVISLGSCVTAVTGETSQWGGSRKENQVLGECTVCTDRAITTKLSCPQGTSEQRHEYCGPCIVRLFEAAIKDESLFPPRCCRQEIPVPLVRNVLTDLIVSDIEEKRIEYTTQDRTYCSNTSCAAFIAPGLIEDNVGLCTQCGYSTCAVCKSGMHKGECPEDLAVQATFALAREQGWQQCSGCKSIVSISTGCNHMT